MSCSSFSNTDAGSHHACLLLSSNQQTLLKWLAMLLMVLDHANRTLWSSQPWLFTLGRLAFPLFAFLIAYNLTVRGVNARRYWRPLLIFGVVSQAPVMLALDRGLLPLNILFTLLLGTSFFPLRLWFSRMLPEAWWWQGVAWLVVCYLMLVLGVGVEYGPLGVLLIPLMTLFLSQPSVLSGVAVMGLLVMVNGPNFSSLAALLLVPVVLGVSTLRLPRLPRTKWLFYAFYPAHLLVLWLLAKTP